MSNPTTPRPVDAQADRFLDAYAALDPLEASQIGITVHDDPLTDFSPEGCAARTTLERDTLAELDRIDDGSISALALRERLTISIELAEAGLVVGDLNVIASPLQGFRDAFDLMDNPDLIATRLAAIPAAIDQAIAGLRHRLAAGEWKFPLLQVTEVLAQSETLAEQLLAHLDDAAPAKSELREPITAAAARFTEVLRTEVAPVAVSDNAIGPERYPLFSRLFLGASVDMAETYAWGQDLLRSIITEQQTIAEQLYPGSTVTEALERLDADPHYTLNSTTELQEWMQRKSDAAVEELSGKHFDIADELRNLACRIAPAPTGGIYYTGPSEDLTRPGTMWWAVPDSQTTFHTWQEATTVYHEGVPGHHLQIGLAVTDPSLNRWRKLMSFTSGHGEGWALYAERLMADLGYLDDLGERMGMLDAQRLRAARVVLDIGYHNGFDAPNDPLLGDLGGGTWDYDKAWKFLTSQVASDPSVLRFELHRYLGWPGQAPSYQIGQRVWQQVRDEYLAANPDRTLRDFHTTALALGGMGLDSLRSALRGDVSGA